MFYEEHGKQRQKKEVFFAYLHEKRQMNMSKKLIIVSVAIPLVRMYTSFHRIFFCQKLRCCFNKPTIGSRKEKKKNS